MHPSFYLKAFSLIDYITQYIYNKCVINICNGQTELGK